MRVPVVIEAWQYECCGEPFEIGALVRWQLLFDKQGSCRRNLGDQAPDWSLEVPVLERIEENDAVGIVVSGGVVVGAGDLRVFLAGDDERVRPGDRVRLRLTLEDHHVDVAESVPPTRGRVQRIRSLTQGYELQEGAERVWVPRPGDVQLEDVVASETFPRRLPMVPGRHFAGFLVDLDVVIADRPGRGERSRLPL